MLIATIFLIIAVYHIHKLQTSGENDARILIEIINKNPEVYDIPDDALKSELHPFWYSNEAKNLKKLKDNK